MTDKFSYYLEDNNEVKSMDHFAALQISEGSFNELGLNGLKSQWKKLAAEFHPDKNGGSVRAGIVFQRIQQAYEVLSDPIKRQQYLLDKRVEFAFDINFVYSDIDILLEELNIKSSQLDELIDRLNRLNKPASSVDLKNVPILEVHDSLEQIALDLSKIYKGTFVTVDVINKQFYLFSRIEELATTGGEFYALYLISRNDRILSQRSFDYLQKGAAKGHLVSLVHMTSAVFAGHFRPLEDSIKWGLNCLRYLEEIVIPKLERDDPYSEALSHIKEELTALRERRNEVLPLVIPREAKAFDELVTQVIAYRNRRGGISSEDFKLAPNMIELLEKNQPLPPIRLIPAEESEQSLPINEVFEEDKEHDLLLKIHSTFAQKVANLRNTSKQNLNALSLADQLRIQLAEAIDTYKSNKANSAMTKEHAKTLFMDTCTTVINNAKLLLEKELGWGDYLTNLLKSFANVFISATNSVRKAVGVQSQFTLFTLAKAPFIPEVEEMENGLYGQLSPK
ncbi:substrate of the Dot/Icm secretion system [Legionella gratiana]|uniref:Chaperone protein DnaJ 1 n=1 Tax=Legionella gratiana TaxID=45066 RepID=A0A378JEG2_9GAMM|nr:J domain-containing protein [Legionella gratiana]KTD11741.1 substrate of the Dot/Icm secretion system [Legionella gratiana]STX45418.1 Chaperone protein DnaJ 1 [Legionella gratiana]